MEIRPKLYFQLLLIQLIFCFVQNYYFSFKLVLKMSLLDLKMSLKGPKLTS